MKYRVYYAVYFDQKFVRAPKNKRWQL